MPTRHITLPPESTPSDRWRVRAQWWTTTPSYATVDRRDLPVNPYTDIRQTHSQREFAGWSRTRTSDGYFQQIANPSPHQQPYDQLDGVHNNILTDSGLSSVTGPLLNATLIKALGKVADQKINISVALAEASKTVNHLTGTATRIFDAYRSFRRGNLRAVAKHLGISPNSAHKSWLEYKYGWMPLLMDVKGGAEALAQYHHGRPISYSVVAREKRLTTWNRELTADIGTGGPPLQGYQTLRSELQCTVKLWLEVDYPRVALAQSLGLTNPALIVWETIPFSFVFDWFISVGDWLQALTALQGVRLRKTMESWEHTAVTTHGYTSQQYTVDGWNYSIGGEHLETVARSYVRSPLTVEPTAIYPPMDPDPLNLSRTITSLALLRTKARRLDNIRL